MKIENRNEPVIELIDPRSLFDAHLLNLSKLNLKGEEHTLSGGRQNAAGYDTYYRQMDAISALKVALTTAYIPARGAVLVDMGFGTGKTSYDLALLYPENLVIGIDIDPHAMAKAEEKYNAPNLRFLQRDFSKQIFIENSVDVFFLSSAVHEVPSYAASERFSPAHIERLFATMRSQLRENGLTIVSDFLRDSGPAEKIAHFPNNDGKDSGAFADLNSRALFLDFIRRFHCHDFPQGNIEGAVLELDSLRPGWAVFRGPANIIDEFKHRRRYTDRWLEELEEQYLHFDIEGYRKLGEDSGMRVVNLTPIINDWIVNNWWLGTFEDFDRAGRRLEFPPNKVHAVMQKQPAREGVQLVEAGHQILREPGFLSLDCYKNVDPHSLTYGRVFELLSRAGAVADRILYQRSADGIEVQIKQGYPRPIINAQTDSPKLDGSYTSGYLTELINGACEDGDSDLALIRERANIELDQVISRTAGMSYLSSPGGVNEKINSRYIEVRDFPARDKAHASYSGFSTSGRLTCHDSRQVLRAYQAGDMFEPRLEVNLYNLHRRLKLPPGQWIGADLKLEADRAKGIEAVSFETLDKLRSGRKVFEQVPLSERTGFMEFRRGTFIERGADVQYSKELEY